MPTAPSIARPSPRARQRPAPLLTGAAAALAIVAMLAAATSVLEGPSRLDVVVENPTVYEINVRAEPIDGGSGFDLGPVASESSRTIVGVIDTGDRWRLEFSYGGIVAAELVLDRTQLDAPVNVPSSAEEVLGEAGLPPSP